MFAQNSSFPSPMAVIPKSFVISLRVPTNPRTTASFPYLASKAKRPKTFSPDFDGSLENGVGGCVVGVGASLDALVQSTGPLGYAGEYQPSVRHPSESGHDKWDLLRQVISDLERRDP